MEDFDFEHARGLTRDLIAHLGGQDFVAAKDNVLNRPGFSQAWIHNHARVSFSGVPDDRLINGISRLGHLLHTALT